MSDAANDSQPNYERLRIWQEAMALALEMYKITANFPKSEIFGLTSQLRRAATSVPMNIAEGSGRGRKEFAHFLIISVTSINETLTGLEIAFKLRYIPDEEYKNVRKRYLNLIPQTQKLVTTTRNRLNLS